jgi:two-component system, NarL family, response regulator NreC
MGLGAPEAASNRATAETDAAVEVEGAIRIVLTDDRDAMRDSLRVALGGEADLEVIAEARDMPSVVRRVHGFLPQVLLLDLSMPWYSSIETLRRLHRQVPQTRIVVLTPSEDPVFARRALDAGATGVVAKDAADGELSHAVRSAAHGERYLSPDVGGSLAALQDAPPTARLTPRELEVLRLIALGYTSVEVADKLDLSPRTIETHRARIHRKLKVDTRAGLVGYALEHGLVTNGVPAVA